MNKAKYFIIISIFHTQLSNSYTLPTTSKTFAPRTSVRQRVKQASNKAHQLHMRYKKMVDQCMAKLNLHKQRLTKKPI